MPSMVQFMTQRNIVAGYTRSPAVFTVMSFESKPMTHDQQIYLGMFVLDSKLNQSTINHHSAILLNKEMLLSKPDTSSPSMA